MFIVSANKNQLTVKDFDMVTSGSVEVYTVQFQFSNYWDGFEKAVIFKTRTKSITVRLTNDECQIPWEVMTTPKEVISIGVYGTDSSGRVLPTIWGTLTTVVEGAIVSDTNPAESTPSLYQQILDELVKTNEYMDEINYKISDRVAVVVEKYINENGVGVTEERVREIVEEMVGAAITDSY